MRLAHSYYKTQDPVPFRSGLDTTVGDFAESVRITERLEQLRSWSDFEQVFFGIFWISEFHRILSQVLVKDRRTLSIGSGLGENEAPFIRDGYDIVCSDINGFRNVVAHEREALLVPCGDTDALADTLVRLLDDDALRARLGLVGRQRALAYGWPRVSDAILGLYARILGANRIAA